MSTTSPIKNWSHPFKPKEGDIDPLKALTAMSKAGSGFYPIGKNGQWHGGIHFDANTAHVFDQSSVRCIADGEVIAYRIDSSYPLSRYLDERDRPRNAPFSTGFVLVKHKLEAPALPASEETPPALTFYSLYMHLLDWSGYSKPGAPTPPAFISETLYQVKPDKATDTVVGLRVRSAPGGTVLAILPKGCKVKVGEVDTADPKWRKLVSILQGRTLPAISGPDLGWVYTEEMQPASEVDQFLVGELANDPEPGLAPEKGLNVRKAGNGRRNDPKTGLLPLGTTFSLEPGTGAYRKLKAIIEGQDIAPLSTNSVNNIQGYVHFESLQATRAVPELDKVQLLAAPYPIKAGDLIGHLGLYQNHDDASPQEMLHLEVFSCEDVPSFITKSRAWAAGLPAEQKSLLKVYKGASKLIRHHEAINASNPPRLSDAGTVVGADLIIPQILLDELPADRKLQISTPVPGSSTPRVTNWWHLDNLLADASGNPISGWLAEQEPITTRHSPWEWVGYDFIQETGRPIRKAAYFFEALRRLTDQELANYRALVSQEDQGPVRSRLYDIIDSNRDNNLTPYEIQTAIKHPWHAQSIAQLITRYESEWLLNKEKWDELDPLMGHLPMVDPNHNWISEKQRIEKLSWWEALSGKQGVNADGKVWHFQTAGLIANFIKNNCNCLNIEKFVEEYKKEHQEVFGWFEADSHVSLQHPLNHESEENLKKLLKMIMKLWGEYFDECNDVYLAYMLATIRVESYDWDRVVFFGPICEKISYAQAEIDYGSGPTGRRAAMAIAYHNTEIGDGFKYRGRGLVQITWKINYEKFSTALGIDFTGNPELALDLENTTRIMLGGMRDGIFSHGNTLAAHLSPSTKNYFTARKIINGSDRANVFKFYAEKFESLLLRIKN